MENARETIPPATPGSGKTVTYEEILAELSRLYDQRGDTRKPGDITPEEFAEMKKISKESARLFLRDLVKQGLFVPVKVRISGHMATIYRKVTEKTGL